MDKAQVFAENVSRLMKATQKANRENMRQFSERIGVPYGWLRRISTKGVQQESSRTLPYLKKLADELGFSDHRRLWEELPKLPDVNEVMAILKARHLKEWCLLVAYLCESKAEHEQRVSEFVEANFGSVPFGNSPGLVADYLSKIIASKFEVVERGRA